MIKLSTAVRRMQIGHVVMTLLLLSFLAYRCCGAESAVGRAPRVPVGTLILVAIAALYYAAIRFALRGTIAAARRKLLTSALNLYDGDSRLRPKDAVRHVWQLHLKLNSLGKSVFLTTAILLLFIFQFERSQWTLAAAAVATVCYAVQFPTQRSACRFIRQELAWLEAESQGVANSGKLPAGIPWRPWDIWDPVCGLPLFRIAAALVAALVLATIWPHLTIAPDDFLPAIVAMPFFYILAIVALLGRKWQKGLPKWMRTSRDRCTGSNHQNA